MVECWAALGSPAARALAQGQFISLLIAGTGVFATILSDTYPNANFPLFMNFLNYSLLSMFLLKKSCSIRSEDEFVVDTLSFSDDPYDRDHNPTQRVSTQSSASMAGTGTQSRSQAWWYLVAAFLDVEANFLVLLAYNYTTITSVMLLDCFTIPCAMVLSYLFLGCRYTRKHFVGAFVCITGLLCIVINDSVSGDDERGSDAVLGDVLCLCGAVLYACSNVFQETLVKFYGRDKFRGYLGGFGMTIAALQGLVVDLPGMRRAVYTPEVCLSIFGFVACLFLMYINTSSFLQESDATVFNLSLLTSDVYAVIFTFFFDGYLVPWPYFLAFGLVLVGLAMYHSEKAPMQVGQDQSGVHPVLLRMFQQLRQGGRAASRSSAADMQAKMRFEYNPIASVPHEVPSA